MLRRVNGWWPPIFFGAAFLGVWEAFVAWRNVRPFVLVPPSKVWTAASRNFGGIIDAMEVSGGNALIGLLLGTAIGCLVALLTAAVRWVGEMVNPLAIAVNAIPIVVLVAVFTRMYEADSETPRRIMTTLTAFFVVFINVSRGLRESSPTHTELMQSYAATTRQKFIKLRLPNAMSFLFTGVRVAAPLTVITAVVAEYFGGTRNGLGASISGFFSISKKDVGLAYVAGASALGLLFFAFAAVLEYVAVPWQRRRESK